MTARITAQIPDDLHAQAKAIAKADGESLSWLIERAIRREVERVLRLRRVELEALQRMRGES